MNPHITSRLAKVPTSAQYRSEQPVKLVAAIVLWVVAVVMLGSVL